jgi:hypothetical protein
MFRLLGVELDVLVSDAKLFERPRNARAGAARPGIEFDCHRCLLMHCESKQHVGLDAPTPTPVAGTRTGPG